MNKKAKILLIGAEDEENLAIRYLAAVLEKGGHSVDIAPCSSYCDIPGVVKKFVKFKPDLIGVSVAFQSLANMFFEMIDRIKEKKPNVHIVVGGHFPTFEFKEILETQKGIDSIIRFEGERPIMELVDAILNNKDFSTVPNLVYRKSGEIIENKCIHEFMELDDLPFPMRSKKPQVRLGEKFATLVASRGCFHSSCLYCCIGAFHSKKKGKKFGIRDINSISEEIADLYHNKGVRLFQFHDDNFMLPAKQDTIDRFLRLRKALESKKVDLDSIAFLIKARPDSIDDDVARTLKELGVVGAFLGIENASETGLKSLCRGCTLDDVNRSMSSLLRYDIIPTFNLLIFHPRATFKEVKQNLQFIKTHPKLPFDFGRAEIVAGSPLEKLVINNKSRFGKWPIWDYLIGDPIVEKIFRINVLSFRKKGSNYSDMAQKLIALGYQAYTLKRLHPGSSTDRLCDVSVETINEANSFIIEYLEKIISLAQKEKIEQGDINDLYLGIKKQCTDYVRRCNKLMEKMSRLQAAEQVFDRFHIKENAQKTRILNSLYSINRRK